MVRFNMTFALLATAVTALACVPMALDRESGFVWTAFLLPFALASSAAAQARVRGEFEFIFRRLPNSDVEFFTTGGRYHQWLVRCRLLVAGFCLSIVFGFPSLHQVDPEPLAMWVPVAAIFALGSMATVGSTLRRRVLVQEREFVSEYLLFGRFCWRCSRWKVLDGDVLEANAARPTENVRGVPFRSFHAIVVVRGRRRGSAAFCVTDRDGPFPAIEFAGHLLAQTVGIPYRGYQIVDNLEGSYRPIPIATSACGVGGSQITAGTS